MIEGADEICDERRSPLEDRHAGTYCSTKTDGVRLAMDARQSFSRETRRQSTLEQR